MSTDSWTGLAASLLLIASSSALLFVCGRRSRGVSVPPRHLDRPSVVQLGTSDTSEEKAPKTPFVAGGTTPRPSAKSAVRSTQKSRKTERSPALSSHEDLDSRPLTHSMPEWTAKSPEDRERIPAGATPQLAALRPPPSRREVLPQPQIRGTAIPMMAVLKRSLPITAYEPLGVLQAACEELRFAARFLDRLEGDEADRMCGVAAFALSGYSALVGRKRKPFNPLLGETFDFISEDGWKYNAEQVSSIISVYSFIFVLLAGLPSAGHAEGNGWTWFQTLEGTPVPAFDGSVSATPIHPVRLHFANGEDYSWNKVTTIIQNAREEAEKRVVRNKGEMVIRSSTGMECRLLFSAEGNSVEGKVKNRAGTTVARLIGQWDRGLNKLVASGEQLCLFEAPPPYEHAPTHYGFSRFTMGLNELHAADRPFLPPTDSRFRPDQRLLEKGEADRAEEAKKLLEKDQRGRSLLAHRPLWFAKERDSFSGRQLWLSNGRYWAAKEGRFEDVHSRKMVALFSVERPPSL